MLDAGGARRTRALFVLLVRRIHYQRMLMTSSFTVALVVVQTVARICFFVLG